MTRFSKIILAAALGGTAIGGAAYAAQDQSTPTASPAAPGMHRHHRGHGDMFAKLDANHDGVITRDEAIAAADARFAKDDTNGDGKITKDEIEAKHAAMRAKWQQRRAARADTAQTPDGAPKPGPHGHRGGRHGHHAGMMQRLDANNDGVVTGAEAEAAATARFDKVDTNHDGKIDQAEIAAAKQQMQARMSAMRAKWQARRAAQAQDQAQPAPTDQPADQ